MQKKNHHWPQGPNGSWDIPFQSQEFEQDGRRHFVGFQPHFHLNLTSQTQSCKTMRKWKCNISGVLLDLPSYCHCQEMRKNKKDRFVYFFRASWRTKGYLPNCKFSRRTYRTTSINCLEKLWYVTNISVLERWRNNVKKNWVSVLYCRCYTDFVSASLLWPE